MVRRDGVEYLGVWEDKGRFFTLAGQSVVDWEWTEAEPEYDKTSDEWYQEVTYNPYPIEDGDLLRRLHS